MSDRVFLRGMTSASYTLKGFREQQLQAPRVRGGNDVVVDDKSVGYGDIGGATHNYWRVAPGDEPFLTQTLQVHFVELPPQSSNNGHGHQNEAAFYILEGRGYEIHDDQRYDWSKGDLVFVHTDSVHQHFNPYDEPAVALVTKAKSAWMYLGLVQQGSKSQIDDPSRFGERIEWGQIWTKGVLNRKKVVHSDDSPWQDTPMGRVKVLSSPEKTDLRNFSVDVFELEIPAGGRSGRRWHMADEILHVISGSGYSLHWEVGADIAEKYYARIANEPTRHDFKTGDTLYVPQNTVAQHFSSDGQPLHMLSAQNRIFKMLGYDNVVYLDDVS